MSKKNSKNQVIVFENNMVSVHSVVDSNSQCVETDSHVFHLTDAATYINSSHGGLVHVFNVDMPAKVEAENLKQLRRSTALKRVFDFDKSTGQIDWMRYLPYFIIILMIFFK